MIAFVEDPNGYQFKLLESSPTPEPLSRVMLRVGDLDRSIKFYEKVTYTDKHPAKYVTLDSVAN